jgi:hypothetical protein
MSLYVPTGGKKATSRSAAEVGNLQVERQLVPMGIAMAGGDFRRLTFEEPAEVSSSS